MSLCPALTPLSLVVSPPAPPQCDKEIEQVQSQLEDYKDPPLSLSKLSLKQQKFKTCRETANVSVPPLAALLKTLVLVYNACLSHFSTIKHSGSLKI